MSERPSLPAAVVDELRAALGAVITDPDGVDAFKDPYGLPGDDRFTAAGVVEPTTVEQVQAVMRIVNAHGVPIWVHSQGRNNGYGGPAARVRGSLLISLRKMNRVLEINHELAYAVVEPGVRWFDLYDALEAEGGDLQVMVPDLGWGSVIGNQMDNGSGYLPLGEDNRTLTGLEVVLADGSLLRTNLGSIPGNKTFHTYKNSYGPSLDRFFAQSNFGIVVRAGVWLQRKPEAYAPLMLTVPRDEDLEILVDTLRDLRLEGTINAVPAIMSTLTAVSQFLEEDVPQGFVTEAEIDALAVEKGVGRWAIRTALWGRRAVVDAKLARIREVWEAIPGATVVNHRIFAPDEYGEITRETDKVQAGIPTMKLMESGQWPAELGHLGFAPLVPLVGSEVRKAAGEMQRLMAEEGLNFIASTYAFNDRTACVVAVIPFMMTNPEQVEAGYRVARKLVKEMGRLGYGEFRAHLDYMDDARAVHSFGDHAYRRFLERIKDAIDPNGVIMPGRHGIWPSRYEHLRHVREG